MKTQPWMSVKVGDRCEHLASLKVKVGGDILRFQLERFVELEEYEGAPTMSTLECVASTIINRES